MDSYDMRSELRTLLEARTGVRLRDHNANLNIEDRGKPSGVPMDADSLVAKGKGKGNKGAKQSAAKRYNCGKAGHYAAYCRTKGSGGDERDKCFNCGRAGHRAAGCWQDKARAMARQGQG